MSFLQLDWQFTTFSDFQQCKLNEEWPKINNEKVNFSRCVTNLKARAITKEL